MSDAMDIMLAYLREKHGETEEISTDPCARLTVKPVQGYVPDVPIEDFTYVHRDATKTRPEHGYVKPAEACKWCGIVTLTVHVDCYQNANIGIRVKGTPQHRKRQEFVRAYQGTGTALGQGGTVSHPDPELTLDPVHVLLEDLKLDPEPEPVKLAPRKAHQTLAEKRAAMEAARIAAKRKARRPGQIGK